MYRYVDFEVLYTVYRITVCMTAVIYMTAHMQSVCQYGKLICVLDAISTVYILLPVCCITVT